MKTCISWTKVCTTVIFHDHEEVLFFQIYDFQMTWCDLYWHKMYAGLNRGNGGNCPVEIYKFLIEVPLPRKNRLGLPLQVRSIRPVGILKIKLIIIVMIKDVRHFQKYDYDVTNCSLDWTESRTPSVCNQTKTKSLVLFYFIFIYLLFNLGRPFSETLFFKGAQETHIAMLQCWLMKGINPNSLDNKGSWRILKDFYCSVTMLRQLVLINYAKYEFMSIFEFP